MVNQTLNLRGIRFSYSRRNPPLFTGLDLTLGNTEGPTVLLGLNGAGKTTLLRLCAGELKPSAGSITVDTGVAPRSAVSLMPQQITPIPGFRVVEQVAYSAWLAGCSSSESEKRAITALKAVQLDDHLTDTPHRLSGGQLRRVGLAQALAGNQPIVMLDEPTAGLDPAQRHVFRDLLTRLSSTRNLVVSTHDTFEIDSMYTRVVVLDRGRIVYDGTTHDFLERGGNSPHAAEEAFLEVVGRAGMSR
ncbi:ATP-binding cassette domain-containing protein [Cutibacterium sp.]|uniref:ATP-binding cassette domain-containing protein n=1 Tax=Cutibacterium sp. TaxID=1912221 RepID=UPI0026DC5E11|nr:ATP-binding cassette domain-containing protein [Cutibacterium sp.]MDO4412167.1 ATP-binding cassette domain-containing protein [Cutibacterium sp.]